MALTKLRDTSVWQSGYLCLAPRASCFFALTNSFVHSSILVPPITLFLCALHKQRSFTFQSVHASLTLRIVRLSLNDLSL